MSEKKQNAPIHNKSSIEPEWIDLEADISEESMAEEDWDRDEKAVREAGRSPKKTAPQGRSPKKNPPKKKKKTGINFHAVLLVLIALVFAVIAFKLIFWDKRQHHNTEMENDTTLSFDTEALDSIVPLDATSGSKKEKDDDLRILFVGNGSLAENKESDTNLANIVREKTGATVYNCAISDSYMTAKNPTYKSSYPYDAFSFYYLCTLFTFGNTDTLSWAERDLGGLPADVKESADLLQSIDYSELDVLCIYYDGSDYLEQRVVKDEENENDPTTFCGALNAGIDLVKELLPDTRIIVMSPAYAYAVDKNGNYSSSFERNVLEEPLNFYVGMQSVTCIENNVSFVDNFYGSIYEEIAPQYLEDHIALNEKGHALLANRFLEALNKFHEYDF